MKFIIYWIIVLASSQVCSKVLDFDYFTITIEDNWPVESLYLERRITILNYHGSSGTLKLKYVFTPHDIKFEKLKSKNKLVTVKKIGDFYGAVGAHKINIDDGSYSKNWILYHKNMLLLVSYASEKEISGLDHQIVQSVLASLRWKVR